VSRTVAPATRVTGDVTVPGDKSISHRALIIGAIARGPSYIGNLSPAADVGATSRCLEACGGRQRTFGAARVALEGSGPGHGLRSPHTVLDCGNSGTTMRLLAGALSGHDVEATLDGDESLRRRPMRRIAEPLRAMGAAVDTSNAGTAPIIVSGRSHLKGITWEMPVASAQVKSAILLAGLSAAAPTTVVEPQSTRDHTERLMRLCGVDVVTEGTRVTLTPSTPNAFGLRVPGDLSAAAFFLALAAARPGWRVRCDGVGLNPGRTGILDVLSDMGAAVEVTEGEAGPEPVGGVEVRGSQLTATTISGDLTVRCIDEIPAIAVLATQAEGTTRISDAAELRTKESDRIGRLADGLRALGAVCEPTADGLVIEGPVSLRGAHIDSAGDHRLAMAWAIAAALVGDGQSSLISGAEAVAVSYPAFFDDLERLLSAHP